MTTVLTVLLLILIGMASFLVSYRTATRVLECRTKVIPEDESGLVTHDEVMRWLPNEIRRELEDGAEWVVIHGTPLERRDSHDPEVMRVFDNWYRDRRPTGGDPTEAEQMEIVDWSGSIVRRYHQ